MADYINSNILCQAYLHVEVAHMTEERAKEILLELRNYMRQRGGFFLYPEIDVDVSFKEGSLKTYLTIGGAIYIFLHQYADFREGVKLFYHDSKRLAASIVSESLFMTRVRHPETMRVEARTGVLGTLHTIVSELDYVERNLKTITADELARHLKNARLESEKLFAVLKDDRDVDLTANHVELTLTRFPKTPTPPPNQQVPRNAVLAYQSEIEEFRKLLRRRKPKNKS